MQQEEAARRTANVGRMAPERIDEARDATRRTRLANERTYLAWWRSGLTALAVSFGIGRLIPEISGGTRWPSVVVGAGFGALGVAFILLAHERQRRVERALASGEYAPLEGWIPVVLTAVGAVLGVSVVLIVVFQG
jgi:putative membrane protein